MRGLKSFMVIAGMTVACGAQAAPQSFYGKTLRVSWNEARSQRVQGEGAFKSVSVPLSYTVYISTKGQLFKRLTSTTSNGRVSGSKDRVGYSGSTAEDAGAVTFQGNTLISTANNHGLGRRIRITFDGGSSCSAEVLTGKSGGGVATTRSNATGKMLEFESVTAGPASCSAQEGDAFAN
ncbi:hypothetical protein [uncultured Bradyrhizobium sp.]|jgi:hypothetical protein|uniref:hypothetical protein n=1 Tax=uncultured Bradyrhizobium sp. TaxID=199684 RepID=UPI002632DB2B|nr:hypothetical protein [uncultured Bradyrhizobium sp.]